MDKKALEESLVREQAARREAEHLLEGVRAQLYESTMELAQFKLALDAEIESRTADLVNALGRALLAEQSRLRFIEQLSHEFFTPLNGISGAVNLMRASPLSPFQSRQIQIVQDCLSYLVNTTQDVFSFQNELVCEDTIDLDALKKSTLQIFHPYAITIKWKVYLRSLVNANHKILLKVSRVIPIKLYGNAQAFQNILFSLTSLILTHFSTGRICIRIKHLNNKLVLDVRISDDIENKNAQAQQENQRTFLSSVHELCKQESISDYKAEIAHSEAQDISVVVHFVAEALDRSTLADGDIKISRPVFVHIQNPDYKSHVEELLKENNIAQWGAPADCVPADTAEVIIISDDLAEIAGLKAHQHGLLISNRSVTADDSFYTIPDPFSANELVMALAYFETQQISSARSRQLSSSLNILVVDDIEVNRDVASQILLLAGHRVRTANDGAECMASLRQEPFDVIIMDIQMPVMDGLDAARAIRALPGAVAKTPLIALTAQWTDRHVRDIFNAGYDKYLSKPINGQALFKAIHELCGETLGDAGATINCETSALGDALPTALAAAPSTAEPNWINFKDVLPRVNNNTEFLFTILKKFVDKNGTLEATLFRLYEDKDLQELQKKIHAIKGASATIGAIQVARTASYIDSQLKQHQSVELSRLNQLADELRKTCDYIIALRQIPSE